VDVNVGEVKVGVLSRYVPLTPFNPFANNVHTLVMLYLPNLIQYAYGQPTRSASYIQNTTSGIEPKVFNQSLSL
jgi:hypothetical protein